jgi:hypothetical protein
MEDHETRRRIIREWMALPKDKRKRVLDCPLEDAAGFVEVAAGVEHEFEPQPVPAPLLDLVEVAAACRHLRRGAGPIGLCLIQRGFSPTDFAVFYAA